MTIKKSLAVVGLFVAGVMAANATTIKLLPAGAKNGAKASVVVWADVTGDVNDPANLPQSAVIIVDFDSAAAAALTTATDFVAGPGWTRNDFNPAYGPGQVNIVLSNTDDPASTGTPGQRSSGPIATINLTKLGVAASSIHLDAASSFGNAAFDNLPFSTAAVGLLPGATRNLGGPISGAPSVTSDLTKVAVVAANTLRLLNVTDLSDAGSANLGAAITGRPSNGVIGAQPVIGIGTTAGSVTLYDANTLSPVGPAASVGTGASSPAITSDGTIYVAANTAGSPALVKITAGAQSAATLAGTSYQGDPAVWGGYAVVSTNAGVQTIRVPDMVPQSTITDSTVTFSPVLKGDGTGVIASATKIYNINAITGAVTDGAAVPTAISSEGWYDSGSDSFYFGAADGSIVNVKGAAVTTQANFLPGAINSVMVLGGQVYAQDIQGNYKGGSIATAVDLGDSGTKAMAATGRTAADSVIAATIDGNITALPL